MTGAQRRQRTVTRPVNRWGVEWHSRNRLDGESRHLMFATPEPPGVEHPVLFRTRADARAWIARRFGYLRRRPDLRAEPFGWPMPRAVRVVILPERTYADAQREFDAMRSRLAELELLRSVPE